jgi:hypothetical protein
MSHVGTAVLAACLLPFPLAPPEPVGEGQQAPQPPVYEKTVEEEIPYPGDRRVNEGAQGRINAIIDEQDRGIAPAGFHPPLGW